MDHDINLLTAIAQIAGIFVGFGALISVTGQAGSGRNQTGQIRAVVTIGLVVVVASMLPVGLSGYGFVGRPLWSLSSLIFLLLIWAVIIFALRMPENRELMIGRARANPMMSALFWLLLEIPMQVPLALAVFGFFPGLEPAFYITALILNLFEAAFVLAQSVYASEPDRLPEPIIDAAEKG